MKVDRARFLLLTTALSAATAVAISATGCTLKSEASDGGSTPTTPTNDSGSDGAPDAASDGYTADSATGDGGACLDDTGLAPTCEGANTSCTATCEHYLTTFKKDVARAIAGCIVALPSCEGATLEVTDCVQNALARACPDPTAEGFCEPLATTCNGDGSSTAFSKSDCTDVATGLSKAGRTQLSGCVQEGQGVSYCKPDPTSCLDDIE